MKNDLTVSATAVTLRKKKMKISKARGQTTVEYLLTTMALVVAFAGFYGFIQQELKSLFTSAAGMILSTWV